MSRNSSSSDKSSNGSGGSNDSGIFGINQRKRNEELFYGRRLNWVLY